MAGIPTPTRIVKRRLTRSLILVPIALILAVVAMFRGSAVLVGVAVALLLTEGILALYYTRLLARRAINPDR